jgi:hypothetical protein
VAIEPIGHTRPEPPRHHPVVPAVRTSQEASGPADEEKARARPIAPEPKLRTDVVLHQDGVQQVVVSDAVTGAPISETPASAVLHVVDAALWQLRQRRES